MVQAFKHHWIGIEQVAKALLKGKFLWFFVPGLIVGLIYFYFQWQAQRVHESITNITDAVPLVGSAITWVTDGVFGIFDLITSEFYKFVILVILSPVNCILSEKFDSYLTGKEYKFDLIRLFNDFLRMILIVISALFMEYIFLGVWWLFQLILPEFIGETIFFLIASFFVGFSFYDYSMERYGLNFFKSWGVGFSKMGYMLITGGIFTLMIKIPAVGIIAAPVLITMLSTATYILLNKKAEPAPAPALQDQDLLDK
nr:EI24 domain-containing protein [uncultured Fluviicola sp.]